MKKIVPLFLFALMLAWSISASAEVNDAYEQGIRAYNAGRFEEAIGLLKGYVEENPRASAYYLIGYSLYKLGRHDEADQYFSEAYLIDTDFSPTLFFEEEVQQRYKKMKPGAMPAAPVQPEAEPVPAPEREIQRGILTLPPVTAEEELPAEEEPLEEPEPALPAVPSEVPGISSPEEEDIVPEQEPSPDITFTPPEGFPEGMEMPEMPGGLRALAGITGFMSGVFGILFQIALYIFASLCLFRIGKKLDVPNSWIAWIPILNYYWPLIGAAGKTLGWGLLYLLGLPLIGGLLGAVFALVSPMLAFVVLGILALLVLGIYLYLWMGVSENLGKERLLGLLMIVPLVNIIFLGYLAFSE